MGAIEIMESLIHFFLYQWQRKIMAFIIAIAVWLFVNHSITSTKTIPSVPIRIINLPVDKTIQGLLPNGFLNKRATLTLLGTKDVIDQLEPGDIEILLDVSTVSKDGIVQITKKNLVSLNPNINLLNHVSNVSHSEIAIKMDYLRKEKIPIIILPPTGEAPEGYVFLDIWPLNLTQMVTGPEDLVLELKDKGLEITFNLNDISKEDLDSLKKIQEGPYDDEVSYFIPEEWKKVIVPLVTNVSEYLNDPDARNLHINFLRLEEIPLKNSLPIEVFYPLKFSDKINPKTFKVAPNKFVQYENEIPLLKVPLFANNVSKLFLEVVKENLQISLVAAPKTIRESLEWDVDLVNYDHLEDTYVAFQLSTPKAQTSSKTQKGKEEFFRKRFQKYMRNFRLTLPNKKPLALDSTLETNQINVQVLNINPSSLP